eukprot:SAG31_NODE_30228_length_384_cov_0.522807_1_plen_55_part_00
MGVVLGSASAAGGTEFPLQSENVVGIKSPDPTGRLDGFDIVQSYTFIADLSYNS